MSKVRYFILFFMLLISASVNNETVIANVFTRDQSTPISELSSFNNIVIFVRFADEDTYNPPFTYAHYESMFNGENQVSVRDYFLEASYNQLTIDSYLVNNNENFVFYNAPNPRSYYQPFSDTNPNGYTAENMVDREHELLRRAIYYIEVNNLVDESVNLDMNDDGRIDSITFLVSGEDDGWESLLWPHSFRFFTYYDQILDQYAQNAPMINGVYAWDYTFELLGNSQIYPYRVSTGIIAHEMFHMLGATDLYHYYRYEWIQPLGDWGI